MSGFSIRLGLALATLVHGLGAFAQESKPPQSPAALDQRACAEYREGDFDSAFTMWSLALESASDAHDAERGRYCYNLGNAAYRAGRTLESVAWYTAALRLSPGDSDAWANLELARAESELEPADRGDLKDTVERLVSSTTQAESEWLAFGSLMVLALCLAGEALRGSLVWRRLSLVALLGVGLSSVPLLWNLAHSGGDPLMVTESRGAQARAEPRADAKRLFDIAGGTQLERLDALPGWVRVDAEEGEVWVRSGTVFELAR